MQFTKSISTCDGYHIEVKIFYHLLEKVQEFKGCPDCHRVLARNSKMPVQNSNFKISARLDLATNLFQILIPTTIKSLMCKKGQCTLQLCPRRWFVRKYLNITRFTPQKSKLNSLHRNFCLSKQEVFRKLPVQKTSRTGPG